MTFELAACTDADMDRAFAIISDAFGHEHPYIDYVFPKHDTSKGRQFGSERLRAIKNSDPNTCYLKVTYSVMKNIAAVAKWNIYDGVIPEEAALEGDFWASEEEKRLAQDYFAGYLMPRRREIKRAGGHLLSSTALDMLAVHPDYQHKGAGRMLVRWGIEAADRMGLEAVVESTRQGRRLYASEAFQVEIECYTVKLSAEFHERDTQSFTWMIRPASKRLE